MAEGVEVGAGEVEAVEAAEVGLVALAPEALADPPAGALEAIILSVDGLEARCTRRTTWGSGASPA